MDVSVYEAFESHMNKLAVDEAMLDAFFDELAAIEKQAGIGLLGGIGGALRGGAAAAKGVGKMLMKGKPMGGLAGAGSRLSGGLAGGFRHGAQLTGRHALKNVALGAGTLGAGAGYAGSQLSSPGPGRRF